VIPTLQVEEAPEARAKAALLNFLRARGRLRGNTAIISELAVGKWTRRADLALCNGRLAAFEIKTREDRLTRLDDQLASYSESCDEVSVVAASRHMNAVMSRVRDHIGIYEYHAIGGRPKVIEHRAPSRSPYQTKSALTDLLPAVELRRLMSACGMGASGMTRENLIRALEEVGPAVLSEWVRQFLKNRYWASSQRFLDLTRGRDVGPEDIRALHIWAERRFANVEVAQEQSNIVRALLGVDADQSVQLSSFS